MGRTKLARRPSSAGPYNAPPLAGNMRWNTAGVAITGGWDASTATPLRSSSAVMPCTHCSTSTWLNAPPFPVRWRVDRQQQRLAFAVHQSWLNNAEVTAVNVCNVLGVYLACRWHLGLSAFVLAIYLPGCVINIFLNFGLFAHLGWFRRLAASADDVVRSAWLDFAELRVILKTGTLFFVQQLCALSLFTAPAVLISAILGAAAVVPFNLAQRLFSLLLVIPNGILPPLWPAYAEAKAKGDWAWISRTLYRSLGAVTGLTIVPMAVVAYFARDLLRLWTGSHEQSVILPSALLVGMLFVWNALVVMQQPLRVHAGGVVGGAPGDFVLGLHGHYVHHVDVRARPAFRIDRDRRRIDRGDLHQSHRLRVGGAASATFDFVRARQPANRLARRVARARAVRRTVRVPAQP